MISRCRSIANRLSRPSLTLAVALLCVTCCAIAAVNQSDEVSATPQEMVMQLRMAIANGLYEQADDLTSALIELQESALPAIEEGLAKGDASLSGHLLRVLGGIGGVPCQGRTASETTAALRAELDTDPAPSPATRVEACLRLLQEEMASPSTPGFGIGGGPIDTGYLQEVIMGSVCTFFQKGAEREEIRALLATELASTPTENEALRERLVIMLGYTGDDALMPQLIEILENHPEGFMRFSAAMALREMPDRRRAIPALQRAAESDTYARIRFGNVGQLYDSVTMVYSPVRDIAAQILTREGIPVPKGIEVVEAKYGVQRLEPVLYEGEEAVCRKAIEILEAIGGIEAQIALQTFVDKKTGVAETESIVEEAHKALDRLGAS